MKAVGVPFPITQTCSATEGFTSQQQTERLGVLRLSTTFHCMLFFPLCNYMLQQPQSQWLWREAAPFRVILSCLWVLMRRGKRTKYILFYDTSLVSTSMLLINSGVQQYNCSQRKKKFFLTLHIGNFLNSGHNIFRRLQELVKTQ